MLQSSPEHLVAFPKFEDNNAIANLSCTFLIVHKREEKTFEDIWRKAHLRKSKK